MRVVVSGARGLVGSALRQFLEERGHSTAPLIRERSVDAIWWDPVAGEINSSAWNNWKPDVLVHLAGENIAARRWSARQKERIRTSRVEATQRLVASLLKLEHRPQTFIGASAIGIFGDRGDEELTERSAPGRDFLSRVAIEWERAADPLTNAGIRVVHLRFGMILSRAGGALAKMLPLFKVGAGGRLGTGRQWMSWIALGDVLRIIEWSMKTSTARGAYNAVSPQPVTNAQFTRMLASALNRPAIIPAPAGILRLTFGEMADALLLSSQRVIPERLLDAEFRFEFPDLANALEAELTR